MMQGGNQIANRNFFFSFLHVDEKEARRRRMIIEVLWMTAKVRPATVTHLRLDWQPDRGVNRRQPERNSSFIISAGTGCRKSRRRDLRHQVLKFKFIECSLFYVYFRCHNSEGMYRRPAIEASGTTLHNTDTIYRRPASGIS
ncbi:hypothetical protein B0H19DRAFT_680042 [Mycena capillaripes]|nr:hypothetical protein B0H19DRAFT_680042 [Mycena capillaripes]